jgi:cell division protein FtsN
MQSRRRKEASLCKVVALALVVIVVVIVSVFAIYELKFKITR